MLQQILSRKLLLFLLLTDVYNLLHLLNAAMSLTSDVQVNLTKLTILKHLVRWLKKDLVLCSTYTLSTQTTQLFSRHQHSSSKGVHSHSFYLSTKKVSSTFKLWICGVSQEIHRSTMVKGTWFNLEQITAQIFRSQVVFLVTQDSVKGLLFIGQDLPKIV